MKHPADMTAHEALVEMAAGRLTSEALCAACYDRIEARNPALNAVVALRDRAEVLKLARLADQQRQAGGKLGPLHGLPMAFKDLVDTKDVVTTYGCPVFKDHKPARNDLTATRLLEAGAILLGKTNVPEFGLGSHSFNEVYGITRNPWDSSVSAGGSSGGAAAALAARMLPLADGSDMMGSLRNPAAWNNIYGFRPGWGLVPLDAPGDRFVATLATNGPMARNVRDLALLLNSMAGPDDACPFPVANEDYVAALEQPAHPVRIGWLGDWGGAYAMEDGIIPLCDAALAKMGAELQAEVTALPAPMPADSLWQSWTGLRAFLNAGSKRALAADPQKWAQLKPELQWEISQGRELSIDALYDATTIRTRWYEKCAKLFEQFDFLALPSAQVWPFPAGWRWPQRIGEREMDTYHRWMEVVIPASLAGLPAISVPVGFGGKNRSLPMGMQLLGRPGGDAGLLAFAHRWNMIEPYSAQLPPEVP